MGQGQRALSGDGEAELPGPSSRVFTGALSTMSSMAPRPMIPAPNRYQAGAIELPVTLISQVTTNWVVPPNKGDGRESGLDDGEGAAADTLG